MRRCSTELRAAKGLRELAIEVETTDDEIVDVAVADAKTSAPISAPCINDALWMIRLDAQFHQARTFRFEASLE